MLLFVRGGRWRLPRTATECRGVRHPRDELTRYASRRCASKQDRTERVEGNEPLVYSRSPACVSGKFDHEDPERPRDSVPFVAASIGPPDEQQHRLLAVAGYSDWCSSTLIHVDLRVVVVANETFIGAVARTVSFRHWDDPPVRATVSGGVAELRDTAELSDGELFTRHRIAR